jgi:hypothetical protein
VVCENSFSSGVTKLSWLKMAPGKNASIRHHVFTPATRTPAGRRCGYIVSLFVTTARPLV